MHTEWQKKVDMNIEFPNPHKLSTSTMSDTDKKYMQMNWRQMNSVKKYVEHEDANKLAQRLKSCQRGSKT